MGANTSEYSWWPCPESFWHRRNLNTNSKTKNKKLQDSRNSATLYSLSRCIRMYTIVQKYALSPSAANKGANTIHHALLPVMTFSTRRTKRTVNSVMARRLIQISKMVSPSHCTNSFNVNNIFSSTVLQLNITSEFHAKLSGTHGCEQMSSGVSASHTLLRHVLALGHLKNANPIKMHIKPF